MTERSPCPLQLCVPLQLILTARSRRRWYAAHDNHNVLNDCSARKFSDGDCIALKPRAVDSAAAEAAESAAAIVCKLRPAGR